MSYLNKEVITTFLTSKDNLISAFKNAYKILNGYDISNTDINIFYDYGDMIYHIDTAILKSNLSEKCFKIIVDKIIKLVDYDIIATNERKSNFDGIYTVKNEQDLLPIWYNLKRTDNYWRDVFPENEYSVIYAKDTNKSLEDLYDYIIEEYNNGKLFYIVHDTVCSDNVKIAMLD